MKNMREELKSQLPKIKFDEALGLYSTFQIGGPADFFYNLENQEELHSLVNFCHAKHIPYFIFGGGSNVLFDDKGFRGLVIRIATKNIKVKGTKITADAGVLVSKLLQESIKHDLTGLEPWIGLPGTVGGAVRGNAGCNGLETKDILTHAEIFNPLTGEIKEAKSEYFHFAYRYSKIKRTHEIVLNATFQLKPRKISKEEQKEMIDNFRLARGTKQPFGKTTGSFFKNPSTQKPAGWLIEEAGLKGKTIGKAQVSEKHGNFFLNLGGATSKDMLKLVNLVKREVKAKFGIELEEEVQIITEKGPRALA